MAQLVFPPGNWNQTITVIDSVVMQYNSKWPGVNLTLWCQTVKGTDSWVWVDLPGPLPTNGTYILHMSYMGFEEAVSVWPTACHFDLKNSKNESQVVNGGYIPLNSAAADAQETTYSRPGATTSGSTPSTFATTAAVHSGTMTSTATSQASQTGTSGTSEPTSGLSKGAQVAVGVSVGIGGLVLLIVGLWALMIFRKKRRAQALQASQANANDNKQHEKAELLRYPVIPHNDIELPAGVGNGSDAKAYSDTDSQGQYAQQWGRPQELMGAMPPQPDDQLSRPGQRYELGA